MLFLEVNSSFPNEIPLDIEDDSFILFYRSEDGMISKRDECILYAEDDWIFDFFTWLYSEIQEVKNITSLAQKYSSFIDMFVNDDLARNIEDNEAFDPPQSFYENIDDMKKSIQAALEDEIKNSAEIDEIDSDKKITNEKLLSAIRGDNNPVVSNKQIEPTTVKFKWNNNEHQLTFPLNVTTSLLEDKELYIGLMDKSDWLQHQDPKVSETLFALWADHIYSLHLKHNINTPKNEAVIFETSWTKFSEDLLTWLRHDCDGDPRNITRKIKVTESKIRHNGKINFTHYASTPPNFIRVLLFIAKQVATTLDKFCIIDINQIEPQYFFAINNEHVLKHIWSSIVHDMIIKVKGKNTNTKQFEELNDLFPNFKEVIDYYSGAMYIFEQTGTPPAPVLLLGSPGLGKTHFANEISKIIGSQMTVIIVSSLTAGWIISGSTTQWKDAQMGKIASSLFTGYSSSPVIVLDEIDKKSEGNYDPLGALYPLLEYQTSKSFVDEYLEFPINASRIIWVATANRLNSIPEPILDRFVVFEVAKLSQKETIKIANTIFTNLTHGLKPEQMSPEILEILKTKTPRQINQTLKKALAYAAIQRTQNIVIKKEHFDFKGHVKKIGF